MQIAEEHTIVLEGRHIEYRLVKLRTGRRLRVRVGLHGVEVFQPVGRAPSDVGSFLVNQAPWVLDQIRRVERLREVRRSEVRLSKEILFRGLPTRIRVKEVQTRARGNIVKM